MSHRFIPRRFSYRLTQESNLLRFATGNQFIVLRDEEEDDGSENGEEADETREGDRVEVGVDEGEEVDETYERMEPDGATADAHPETRIKGWSPGGWSAHSSTQLHPRERWEKVPETLSCEE